MPNENIDIRVRMRNARAAAAEARGVGGAVGGIGKRAKESGRHARGMGRGFVYARKTIGPLRAGVTGLSGALGVGAGIGLVGALKASVEGWVDHQKVTRQSRAVIKSTGGAAKVTSKDVGALSDTIERKTTMDGDLVQQGANMLLTFTNIRNEAGKGNKIFNQATKTVTDMSAALGQDTKNSAIQLGKALNDPIKGVTALQRVGVTFTEQQKSQIATLVKSGKTVDAQKLILRELNKEFGGSAKAQATPFSRLQVQTRRLGDTVGKFLLPYLTKGTKWLTKFLDEAQSGTGKGGRFVETMKNLWHNVKPVVFWFGRAAKNVGKFAAEHPGLAKMAAAGFIGYRAFKLLGGVKLVKLVGWIIKLRKAGKQAKVAEAIASNLGTLPAKSAGPLGRFRGYLKGKMGAIGAFAGGIFAASFIAQLTGIEDADPLLFLHPPSAGGPKDEHDYMHNKGPNGKRKSNRVVGHETIGGVRYTVYADGRRVPTANVIPRSQRRRDPHGAPGASVRRPRARVAEPAAAGGGTPELPGLQVFIDGRETARSTARWTDADRNRR